QLGFDIEDGFVFESVPFLPDGTLEHTGDITFLGSDGALVTLGDFSIGFDGDRVSDTASGFFVADTLDNALTADILFDIGVPGRTIVADGALTIADADLLLSPELAEALELETSAGVDVGDVRIDAEIVPLLGLPPGGVVTGSGGDDVLVGSDGDDVINGLQGDDTYTGGAGADQFVLAIAQGVDVITDFEQGTDQIQLGGLTPEGMRLLELGSDTFVLTRSNELLGVVQGVTGLDSAVFA
ncbi:MAG: hypothetical protein AAF289_20865, partial [Cyanobacteria bacterium P01_A01_bin.135]